MRAEDNATSQKQRCKCLLLLPTVGHVVTLLPLLCGLNKRTRKLWLHNCLKQVSHWRTCRIWIGHECDSTSGRLVGAHYMTFILTSCCHTTFMQAVEEQLVSDQAPSQMVLNYIIQLFLFFICK